MSDRQSARMAARLFAVQALYQMDIAKTPLETILAEFGDHRLGSEIDGVPEAEPDRDHFEAIVRGVIREQDAIDNAVNSLLSDGWHLSRIDSTLRAILRCAGFELMAIANMPAKVVVSSYTDIAHGFFDGPEGGVTNAVLDRLAKSVANSETELLPLPQAGAARADGSPDIEHE